MKVFIICLLLFALEQATAAPRARWLPLTKPAGRVPPRFPLYTGTPGPRILGGGQQDDKTATNQVLPFLPPALAAPVALDLSKPLLKFGASLGKNALKRVVCDSTSWLQEYAGSEERDAKIMALVKVMSDMLTAQVKLGEAKKLNMEDNLVAKAELFDLVSDALEGALDVIGDSAKEVLCSE